MDYNIHEINPYIIRCGFYNDTLSDKLIWSIPGKTVLWYEMELVIEGCGFVLTDGERLPLKEGRLFFRVPGMKVQPLCTYKSYFVLFDMIYDRAKDYTSVMGDNRIPPNGQLDKSFLCFDFPGYIDTDPNGMIEELFRSIYEEYVNDRFEKPIVLKAQLLRILMCSAKELLVAEWQDDPNLISLHKRFHPVQEYIKSNYGSCITLDMLAGLSGLSRSHFCRAFKALTGDTPFEHVNKCRIGAAKRMLIESDVPLKEIVFKCGFNSYSYFCSQFKRLEHKSPIAFRNDHRPMKAQTGAGTQQ